MADYQLTSGDSVYRNADGASIPNDPANDDRIKYKAWLDAGGVPDPPPPPPPPTPTPAQAMTFDHENRIRVLEGLPPLAMADFINKMQGA